MTSPNFRPIGPTVSEPIAASFLSLLLKIKYFIKLVVMAVVPYSYYDDDMSNGNKAQYKRRRGHYDEFREEDGIGEYQHGKW